METDDKIIERIRQLLAMAADTSSPNEASIAAGRARKLMDKHQVALDDLKEESSFGYAAVGKEYRFMPKWLDILAVGVAWMNDCKVLKQHKWKSINSSYSYQLTFQGFEADVQCAKAIFDYLVEEGERMCKKYMVSIGEGSHYKASIGDPYKRGYASKLQDRMKEILEQRRGDATLIEHKTGTALVIFKMAQVEAEFGEFKTSTKNMGLRLRHDAGAAALGRGRLDGGLVDINRKLDA